MVNHGSSISSKIRAVCGSSQLHHLGHLPHLHHLLHVNYNVTSFTQFTIRASSFLPLFLYTNTVHISYLVTFHSELVCFLSRPPRPPPRRRRRRPPRSLRIPQLNNDGISGDAADNMLRIRPTFHDLLPRFAPSGARSTDTVQRCMRRRTGVSRPQ